MTEYVGYGLLAIGAAGALLWVIDRIWTAKADEDDIDWLDL